MKTHLFTFMLLLVLAALAANQTATAQTETRRIGIEIDSADGQAYARAAELAQGHCVSVAHFFLPWDEIETDSGQYGGLIIVDILNAFFPAFGMGIELNLPPLNFRDDHRPEYLRGLPFDDPRVIAAYERLLDTTFARLPDAELFALNIGNEYEPWLAEGENRFERYRVFYEAVRAHADSAYAARYGQDLTVGTTLTFGGLTDEELQIAFRALNENSDVVSVNYYPLNGDFTVKAPDAVLEDFNTIAAAYPDKTIYFAECGYPTSAACESSEELQAEFVRAVFDAWDAHAEQIPYIGFFRQVDWSPETVQELVEIYGLDDEAFLAFLGSLGFFTYPDGGQAKAAWDALGCAARERNFCAAPCQTSRPGKQDAPAQISVFPNPANGQAALQGDGLGAFAQVEIFDWTGRRVAKSRAAREDGYAFSLAGLAPGVYAFRVETAVGEISKGKLVLE